MRHWAWTSMRRLRGGASLVLRGRGRSFTIGDVPIRYFEQGDGEPVILIHGFTRSAAAWSLSGVAAELAREYRVLALDCRGHGGSGRPAGTAAYGTRMADDVVALLDDRGLESAHLIGHSMGGRIALRLAAARPDRVRSVILIASGGTLAPRVGETDPMPIEHVARALESGGGFGPLVDAVLPQEHSLPRWKRRFLAWAATLGNDPQVLAAVARSYRDLVVSDRELTLLPAPVKAIIGSADPYRTAVAALARRMPDLETAVIEGATHLDILARAETHQALRAFLSTRRLATRRIAARRAA